MATTTPIKSISAAKPPDIKAARAAYIAAIQELPSPERISELLKTADLANVRLKRDLSEPRG